MRRILLFTGTAVLALVLAMLLGGWWTLRTQAGRDWLTAVIPAWVSTADFSLSLGRLTGAPPGEMALDQVAIADADGVWLRASNIQLQWSPWDLISGRVHIDVLTAQSVEILRPPRSAPVDASTAPPVDGEALALPRLPIAVTLSRLAINEITLAEPVMGQAARLTLTADAKTGTDDGTISAHLALQRLDAPGGEARLRLSADPSRQTLDLDVSLHEPTGGMLAQALALDASTTVDIALAGSGSLADWRGQFTANAGPTINISGPVQLRDQSAILLDLQGVLAGLAPEAVRPLLAGTSKITLAAELAENGVVVPSLSMHTAAADITGSAALHAGALSGEVNVITTDAGPWQALAGQPIGWTSVNLGLQLAGTLVEPALHLTLTAQDLDLAAISPEIGAVVGRAPQLALMAHVRPADSTVTISDATLTAATLSATASASLRAWGSEGDFAATVTAPDLAGLSDVAGFALAGTVQLDATGAFDAVGGVLTALTLQGHDVDVGLAALTPMIGREPKLDATLALTPTGALSVSNVDIVLQAAQVNGRIALDAAGLDADLTAELSDLAALAPGLRGTAQITLVGGGNTATPEARFTARAERLSVNGQSLGTARLDSSVAWDGQTLRLSNIKGAALGAALSGNLALDSTGPLAQGALQLKIADWQALQRLSGMQLDGTLVASAKLSAARGKQAASVSVTGTALQVDAASVGGLSLQATLSDLMGKAALKSQLTLADTASGTTHLRALTATIDGPLTGIAWTLDATLAQPEARLRATGKGAANKGASQVSVSSLTVASPQGDVRLLKPLDVVIQGGSVRVSDLALSGPGLTLTGRGALAADGSLSGQIDSTLQDFRIVKAITGTAAPRGKATLTAKLAGTQTLPVVDARLSLKGIGPAGAEAGIPGIDVVAALNWDGRDARATAQATAAKAGDARVDAAFHVPLQMVDGVPVLAQQAPLDGQVTGKIDLAVLGDALSASGDRAAGTIDLNVALAGTVAEPTVNGAVEISEGRYDSAISGARLHSITGRLVGSGSGLRIERFEAHTADNGVINASGTLSLVPGPPHADVRVTASNAVLADTDLARLVAGADLALTGALDAPRLAGNITVNTLDITVPEDLPPSVVSLDYTEVGGSYRAAPKAPPRQAAPPLDVALDLVIDAPSRVFVRGRGLDAELGGKLKVAGTSRAPIVTGGLSLRYGTLSVLGNSYTFERGNITFDNGALVPHLDMLAVAQTSDAKVGIAVSGAASAPTIALTSDPELTQDEMLARLVFGKPAGALSAIESVRLAQSAAQLAGIGGGGPGLVGSVRRGLQLDRLELTGGSEGTVGGGVTAGRYLNDRVFVGVEQQFGGTGSASVEVEVTDTLTLESRVGDDGNAQVGIKYEKDY
jgi:translocation and assembly module TamB